MRKMKLGVMAIKCFALVVVLAADVPGDGTGCRGHHIRPWLRSNNI